MKNLSANKVIVLAACAASTASSATSSTSASSSTRRSTELPAETRRIAPWGVVKRIPRGGSNKSDDDDAVNGKSKKASSSSQKSKKKKSSKSAREETKTRSSGKSNPLLEEIIRQDDFYDILGVTKSASDREIQKAYRKRCVQTHPDKTGGDRRAFDKVAEAYDVLSDDAKRQTYNRFGKAGLDPTNPGNAAAGFGGGSANDMFRSMFQQAQQQRQQQQRRNQTLRYQLEVTLEDLYYGRTQSVTVAPPRNRRQTYQQHQQRQQQRKEVEVHIEKGSLSGQSIVMSGEVDFNNDDSPPGDLVFILTQKPHSTFTRKGHDLAMELTISLEEALCGLRRPIKHLNGSELWVESATRDSDGSTTNDGEEPSESNSVPIMIRTGDVHVLKGFGMPKRNQNGEFGDLYIQYRVDMPQSPRGSRAASVLTNEEYKELSRLLSKLEEGSTNAKRRRKPRNRQSKEDGDTIHSLKEAKSSDFGTASGRIDFEEEEGPGGIHDEDEGFDPFGAGFFGGQGFGGGGRTYSQQFHFGGPGGPFGGGPFGGAAAGDDDGNVQCQQM